MLQMNELNSSDLGFYNLCRLCASYDKKKISLFSDEGKRRRLKDKIQCCLPFKVEEHDAFPKSLCFLCVENLESTYEFRYRCIQVNKNLEKYVSKEKEKLGKFNNHPQRIRPEVSIFALPPSGQTNIIQNANESGSLPNDSEDAPNPLDFLEVGVNTEDSSHNTNRAVNSKSSWNSEKRWLPTEYKTMKLEQVAKTRPDVKFVDSCVPSSMVSDENGSRRKNNNPRKIAREIEDASGSLSLPSPSFPAAPALIAISIAPVTTSSSSFITYSVAKHSTPKPQQQVVLSNTSHVPSKIHLQPNKAQTFSCLLCDRSFSNRVILNEHFLSTHGIEPYDVANQIKEEPIENVAERVESQPCTSSLEVPPTTTMDDDIVESMVEQETVAFCEVCRREFQDRASLWLHMVHAHREEASLSCGICLKIFTDSITLIEHVNTAHSEDKAVIQRRYSCQVCGRQHDSRQKLLKHAALHTLIDNQGQTIQPEEMISLNNAFAPRECQVCHKKFFSQDKLIYHMQNFHTDTHEPSSSNAHAVLYKCELCDSTHATRIDRWWHMFHSHNGDVKVTCQIGNCKKIFVTQAIKEEHCSHHETQGEFTNTCEVCGKMWESRTVFFKHMMNVHPKCLPSVCGVCMKIFCNVPELRQHVKADHQAIIEALTTVCCDVCGRAYAERSKMIRHRRVHNVTDGVPFTPNMIKAKDDLQCNACPELVFDTLEKIGEHRRAVHQLFVCDLCPKFYNGNNHLWKHVSKQHRGDPSVTCGICLRTSASRAHLQRHKLKYHSDPIERLMNNRNSGGSSLLAIETASQQEQQHRPPRPPQPPQIHKCDLCAKEFRIPSMLNKHLKCCKGGKPAAPKYVPINGMYHCRKCNKKFEQQGILAKHMRNSHVVYYCEACPASAVPTTVEREEFDKKGQLLQHIREKHTNDPRFFCDVEGCNKVLRVMADLQKHKIEHSRGYFTYICECCGDLFSNRKKLRKHLVSFHKGEVEHICAICVAILPSVNELSDHVKSNHPMLMFRPFTCQICGKCCTASGKAVDHVIKAHGSKFRPCKICWKVFDDEKVLEEHTENHPPAEERPVIATTSKKEPPSSNANDSTMDDDYSSEPEPEFRSADADSVPMSPAGDGRPISTSSLKRKASDELFEYEECGKQQRKKYRCISCKETFRSFRQLVQHTKERHRIYDNHEYSVESAKPDVKDDTDVDQITCGSCSRPWNSKKQLWQHMIRAHPQEAMHTCGICLKVCANYYDLFYHLDQSHLAALNESAAKFSCPVCGHFHNSHGKLERHVGVHKEVPKQKDSYRCEYCQKCFRSVVFFREHERTHAAADPKTAINLLKKEPAEFSGFSIKSILGTSTTTIKKKENQNEDEHEDDIELDDDGTLMEEDDEDDDEDMLDVEENGHCESRKNEDDTTRQRGFRGYKNNSFIAKEPQATVNKLSSVDNLPHNLEDDIEEDEEEEEGNSTADLESNISSCSSVSSVLEEEDEENDDVEEEEADIENQDVDLNEQILNGKPPTSLRLIKNRQNSPDLGRKRKF